jgi:hypothetical protein
MSHTSTDSETYDPDAPMYCANHPSVETRLRCGRCGRPICAKCRVSTPAGFRCMQCANLQVVPTYAVSTDYYLKSILAGLGAAAAAGVLMGLFPAFEFWVALIMGIAVPEAVTGVANQKRGAGLQRVAMACILFGFVVSRAVLAAFPGLIPLGGINYPSPSFIPVVGDAPYYVSMYTVLWLAMALFLAYRRLR